MYLLVKKKTLQIYRNVHPKLPQGGDTTTLASRSVTKFWDLSEILSELGRYYHIYRWSLIKQVANVVVSWIAFVFYYHIKLWIAYYALDV